MSIFAKSLPERLSSYLINLGNLMITYNRKGFFAQAKALKQRMDRYTESVAITIRLREEAQTQQTMLEEPLEPLEPLEAVDLTQTQASPPLSQPLLPEDDDDLFAEESQGETRAHELFEWEEESAMSSESSVGDWGVLEAVEVENETPADKRNASGTDSPLDAMMSRREMKLLAKVEAKSVNPVMEAKSRMELASFYQENQQFAKAVTQYERVASLIGNSRKFEELGHCCNRCLSVCLREAEDAEKAVEVLNKDIDVLLFRKTRSVASEFEHYYKCELQRSYEELGNSHMK